MKKLKENKIMIDYIKFWRHEWKIAERSGNVEYALTCKEEYRIHVMESLSEDHNQQEDKLKAYPMLMLN